MDVSLSCAWKSLSVSFHLLCFPDYSKGFGGKYGVQSDRVDKSAKTWDEKTKTELHASQTDHKKGFGGKFGVETDKVDKSAKGWSEQTKSELHPSQRDFKKGFGGKFGVEDRQDEVSSVLRLSHKISHMLNVICLRLLQSAHGWSEQTGAPSSSYQKVKPNVQGMFWISKVTSWAIQISPVHSSWISLTRFWWGQKSEGQVWELRSAGGWRS